jgi:hypothetical protein
MIRKVTLTLSAVALVLMAAQASAQNQQRGAACILELTTSIITPVACNGRTGACGCGPGWISACAPRCCQCVRCRR